MTSDPPDETCRDGRSMDPQSSSSTRSYSDRKRRLLAAADASARDRDGWIARHAFFFEEDWRYLRHVVPEGKRVLDLGCGTGALLGRLRPSLGVGVDLSRPMIDQATARWPNLTFVHADVEYLDEVADRVGGPFDFIIMSDTIGSLDDCWETFRRLHRFCNPQTRVVISYHSPLWAPLSGLYSRLRGGQHVLNNWLSSADIANLLELANFQTIKREWRLLTPFRSLGLGRLVNRFVATLPLIRKFCLRTYVIARPHPQQDAGDLSVTVVVPCRNERGNIESAITRLPRFARDIEVIYVEGGSSDGTWGEIQRVKTAYPDVDIKAMQQTGRGKGDAVRLGIAQARGDILMILDADLTMPPEDLVKFYDALVSGKGEFINGSRLIYPREKQAMRLMNLAANHAFAGMFTYLLNQRYTDTLCGTKVLRRSDYLELVRNRAYFGDFDPFGDFDLILGADKLNLRMAEVPIRYAAREYGETQISRFRHGWLLLKMVCVAFMKLKAL